MTSRRSLSTTRKLRIFEAAGGLCHICGTKIFGKGWDAEHVIPLALGGADDDRNLRPAHKACHGDKTKIDNASWSKAKRMRAKHYSIRGPSGFRSKYRKKMDGTVVLRS